MSLAVTYDGTPDAVEIAVTGLPDLDNAPVTAIVQRSTDGGITWTTVRGMAEAEIAAGALSVYPSADYEFRPDLGEHTYRAGISQTFADAFARTVAAGGWGTSDSGAVWTGAASQLSVATGFGKVIHDAANQTVTAELAALSFADFTLDATLRAEQVSTVAAVTQGFRFRAQDSNNTYRVDLSWGLAGAVTLTIRRFIAGVQVNLVSTVLLTTYSASEEFHLELEAIGSTLRARAYQEADAPPTDWTVEIEDDTYAAGTVLAWSRRETGNTNANAETRFVDIRIDDGQPAFLGGAFTQTITPTTDRIWIKSTTRPFMNMTPLVIDWDEGAREARGGGSAVAGRTLPLAQVELSSGRSVPLEVWVSGAADRAALDFLIASGDVLFVQVPAGCPVPTGYFRIDSSQWSRFRRHGESRRIALPLTEYAAPGPDVAAALSTWDSLIASYGTWDDVVAAFASWDDLLAALGEPSSVIIE
jgi:hypothetical protein